jgi:hypothetical protein
VGVSVVPAPSLGQVPRDRNPGISKTNFLARWVCLALLP